MKISGTIRYLYIQQKEINVNLKTLVENKLVNLKEERWHYESRLKDLESFALKLQSGRVNDPKQLEDFFACTLVVENRSGVERAEALVSSHFDVAERRPPSDKRTHKSPNEFPFDDLRLYARWKDDPALPPTGVDGALFEVQIKTFLQHAWAIATHDLIYKTDSVNWAKERIAYHIKAMLEHAEVSILEAEKLAQSSALDKTDSHIRELLRIIELLREFWEADLLPHNLVVLARNILALIQSLKIDLVRLREILTLETEEGKGAKTLNLSPYEIVTQALIYRETIKVKEYLMADSAKHKIFIPDEIELPDPFKKDSFHNLGIIINSV